MVYVWDSVAGHYTRCHSLSPSATQRILATWARREAAGTLDCESYEMPNDEWSE